MAQSQHLIDGSPPFGEPFPVTQWTLVLNAANPDSREHDPALQRFCQIYWFPLYAYARRRGHSAEEAEDLTQEYFARLIRKDVLCDVDRQTGKFRCFLLTTFKHFLVNEWHKARAQRRGNGVPTVPIDQEAEIRYARHLVSDSTPETLFERHWALSVLDRVFRKLEAEYTSKDKARVFAALRGCLPGEQSDISYSAAAESLQMSAPAIRMAAHRLRLRYRELLRSEIGATVSKPEEIDGEIRELIECLSQR